MTAAKPTFAEGDDFEGFADDDPGNEVAVVQPEAVKTETVKKTKKKTQEERKEKKAEKENKSKAPKEKKAKAKKSERKDGGEPELKEPERNLFTLLEEDAVEDETDVSAWAELDLSPDTLSALSKLGFQKPTLIQSSAIPEIMAGHDVVGKASTGSGKTLAFGIPILESWIGAYGELDEDGLKATRPPTALILSPTRELAHQLTEHITALCKGLPNSPYVAAVTGGLSVQKQQRQLAKADVVIGTPGRLWEVMSSSIELTAAFKKIKFLVVDEADRLLTEGHFKEAEEIIGSLDRQQDADGDDEVVPTRQTLVFSATFHKGLQQKLTGKGKQGLMDDAESMEYLLKKLNFREDKPKFVDVNPVSQMAEGLKEGMVECAGTEKVTLSERISYHFSLNITGSLPLLPPPLPSQSTYPDLHQLHPLRAPSHSFTAGSQFTRARPAFADGAESPHALHRALLLPQSHVFHPGRHRRRSPRSRHRRRPARHPLPSPPRRRHVRASVRTHSAS